MSGFTKNKIIPLCALALACGYFGAEYIIPKYFNPQTNPAAYDFVHEESDANNKTEQFISLLRARSNNYVRKTKSGNYLAGKFAQNQKDWGAADKFISQVLPALPNDENIDPSKVGDLHSHAMILAMSASEYDKAIRLAQDVHEKDPNNIFATLFVAIDYFKKAQYIEADATLKKLNDQSIATFITPILSLWANTVNRDGSVNKNITTQNLLPTNIYAYHALLAGLFTDQKQAVEEYAIRAFKPDELDARDAEKFADIFYLYGQKDVSLLLLKILQDRNFSDENIDLKISNLEAAKPIDDLLDAPKIETPKEGAALILSDMAEILVREHSDDVANIFSQMALFLDPSLTRPHFIISDIYARNERLDNAINELNKIKTNEDNFVFVQRKIADLYDQQEKDDKAIATLQKIYDQTKDIDALNHIGDIYRYNEEYDKALRTYTKILNELEPVPEKYWYILYARGMTYERLNEYKKSEIDLLKALEFRPDEPYILNYLGYSWADQGIKLEPAMEMIQRAHTLRPEDGYIADSLGWVHYKLENYEDAITYLERAVELLPYDPTINDHLGDAYWRMGRTQEAQFQWQRALNNQEDEDLELTATIQNKLLNGLSSEKTELSELPHQPGKSPETVSNSISDL